MCFAVVHARVFLFEPVEFLAQVSAKKKRFEVRKFSVQSALIRDARYGLRGVRIGKAAHPGLPKLILRGVQVNMFNVLANLSYSSDEQ